MVQIASTWEGIRACEELQKQGIDTNMTLLFSFGQVHAAFMSSCQDISCCLTIAAFLSSLLKGMIGFQSPSDISWAGPCTVATP